MTLPKTSIVSFLIFFFGCLSSACATLGGRQQPVAVDTAPRGVAVGINGSVEKGDARTPLAVNVKRSSSLELEYQHDVYRKKNEVDCKVRVGTVFGGNLTFGLLTLAEPLSALVVYASAVGLDFLSGAAFECPHHIQHALSVPEALAETLPETCSRVLILAPGMEPDLALKAALVEEAQGFAKRVEDGCLEFVPAAVSADALQRSMLENETLENIVKPEMSRKLAQLLRDTGAVKAVELRLEEQTDSFVTVSFSFWDLYAQERESTYRKNFNREKFDTLKGGWVSQFLGRSLKLLPNSVTLSASNPTLNLADNIPNQERRIGRRGSLVGLLSVTSVEHPNQYDTWGTGIQFGPALFIDSIAHQVEVDRERITSSEWAKLTEAERQAREFRAYALTLPVDAVLSLHTPAGAFRIFVGYGPLVYIPTSKTSESLETRLFGAAHAGLDWVAYFSDNVFFHLGAHAISRSKTSIEEQGAFKLMGWQAASLGVGYYFPATSGYVESLLSQKDK